MKILLVHQYFLGAEDAGGSRWNQFSKYWSEAGHEITVLCGTVHYATGKKDPKYKGKFVVTESAGAGVTLKRCHVSEAYNVSFIGRLWAYLSFAMSSTWAGLRAGRHDVLICTSPPLTVGLTGILLSKLKRIPLVFEIRDLWPESAIETGALTNKWLIRISYWLEKSSYRAARLINVLTPAFETALVEKKGISKDKIIQIPNGADIDLIEPGERNNWVREEHKLGNKFVVTYVGAHGVANRLGQLLDAAALLKVSQPDVQIMLVGDGMEKPMLKERALRENLTNVTFVDPVPKHTIGDFLAASDVCTAVLQKIDTFTTVYPNKVFDYMSAKRPTLLGIDGVARKLVEDAGAGIFVEPENARAIADGIIQLKEAPGLRIQMGEQGYAHVRANYVRSELAKKYLASLQTIAG